MVVLDCACSTFEITVAPLLTIAFADTGFVVSLGTYRTLTSSTGGACLSFKVSFPVPLHSDLSRVPLAISM